MINLTGYIDKFNMIVMRDGDGGDSAASTGRDAFLRFALELPHDLPNFGDRMVKHQVSPGVYRRHPDPDKWYSDPTNFSRDQHQPIMAGLATFGLYAIILQSMIKRLFRLGFYPNIHPDWVNKGEPGYKWKIPDWGGFGFDTRCLILAIDRHMIVLAGSHLGRQISSIEYSVKFFCHLYLLGVISTLTYPILLITDLVAVIDAISILVKAKKDPLFSDDVNFITARALETMVLPTPFTYISKLIYMKYRPSLPTNLIKSGPESAIADYYNPRNGSVPFGDAFTEVIRRYL